MSAPETSSRPRVKRGVPTGGQFTADRREEPDVRLHRSDLEDRLNSALGEPGAQVLDALTRAGGHPYLVGGCVRDGLLGLDPKDVDIEVYGLTVEQVGAALEPLGDVSEVGASFAVTTVRVDGHDFDVALPRAETKNGPGHTGFDVTANPHAPTLEASARRDFTINAMMFDPAAAELVDHWGGQRDLEGRVLRHTTSAFADDPLRVLRGARFAARFDMTMHPDTVALARSIAGEFHTLPVERVWSEWRSLASTATHPSRALQVLADARHVAVVPDGQRTQVGGLPVTTLPRTVADCAMTSSPAEGLVIVDAALRAGLNLAEVSALLEERVGCRGVRLARELLACADAGAESPGESCTRLIVLAAGLPRPTTQLEVRTHLGRFRADMGWEAWRLLIEYDGRSKYAGAEQETFMREKRRADALMEAGWRLVRVTKEDLRSPEMLVARVRRAAPGPIPHTPRPALRTR